MFARSVVASSPSFARTSVLRCAGVRRSGNAARTRDAREMSALSTLTPTPPQNRRTTGRNACVASAGASSVSVHQIFADFFTPGASAPFGSVIGIVSAALAGVDRLRARSARARGRRLFEASRKKGEALFPERTRREVGSGFRDASDAAEESSSARARARSFARRGLARRREEGGRRGRCASGETRACVETRVSIKCGILPFGDSEIFPIRVLKL
eukprot:30784-Pelagococcus_subviridis.AAC.3